MSENQQRPDTRTWLAAHLYEPSVAIELDVALRNAAVRTVVEPADGLTRLDGTHAAGRSADR